MFVNGEVVPPRVMGDPDGWPFWGFTSDTPFTEIEFRGLDLGSFQMDNVIFEYVPEPATATLCIAGLALLVGRRRDGALRLASCGAESAATEPEATPEARAESRPRASPRD